ncbi:hypothetical protein [uncultured Selenomonas sp.]|nr:hypothetical protein [uncultured Selenomonas sp.]
MRSAGTFSAIEGFFDILREYYENEPYYAQVVSIRKKDILK